MSTKGTKYEECYQMVLYSNRLVERKKIYMWMLWALSKKEENKNLIIADDLITACISCTIE